jgi:hypothetical protein
MPFTPYGYQPDFPGGRLPPGQGQQIPWWAHQGQQAGSPWTPGPTSPPPPVAPPPVVPPPPVHQAPDWKQQLWAKYVAAGKPGDWNAYMMANRNGAPPPGQPPVNATAPPPTQPQMPGGGQPLPQQPVTPAVPAPQAPAPQGRPPMPQPWTGPNPQGWDRVPTYWERNHLAEFRTPQPPPPPIGQPPLTPPPGPTVTGQPPVQPPVPGQPTIRNAGTPTIRF